MSEFCTLLVAAPDKVALPSQAELQIELESPEVSRKIAALKKAIQLLLTGEDMPRTLMSVIRYCITVEDHTLQKLLMLYWEVARKYDASGKLLPEMILVCNALRNNLIHPNEYVRGCTLRFLTKLREPELLEPLVPSIKLCLSHRHAYVRRNAVLAVFSVFKNFKDLYPDAPEDIEKVLDEEADACTRRNAFVMLFSCALDRALVFLAKNLERVLSFGDGFALILLDLIRRVARTNPALKAKFIRIVFALLDTASSSVSFEAASTLTALSSTPSAARAASAAFIKILNKESDNNVKLIILDRLSALRRKHGKVLREQVMDILRCLASPSNDIRRRTLDVAMDLVAPRNVDEVMALLRKEVVAASALSAAAGSGSAAPGTAGAAAGSVAEAAEALRYRTMLITAIHGCAIRFPDVAPAAVALLLDLLAGDGSLAVIECVREVAEAYPALRGTLLAKLRDVMGDITSGDTARVALWLLGQYSESDADVDASIHAIRQCVGPLPLVQSWPSFVAAQRAAAAGAADAAAAAGGASAAAAAPAAKKGPVVLADGTYASQSAASESSANVKPGRPGGAAGGAGGSGSGGGGTSGEDDGTEGGEELLPKLRQLLLSGDFFLGAVVASTLSKLALRVAEAHGREHRHSKAVIVDALLAMCALLELGASGVACTGAVLPASLLPAAARIAHAAGMGGYKAPGSGATGGAAAAAAGASVGVRIDQDSFERIVLCMRVLGDPAATAAALPVLLHGCKDAFSALLADRRVRLAQAAKDGVAAFSAIAGASGSAALMFGTGATTGGVGSAASLADGADAAAAAGARAAAKSQVDDCLYLRLLTPNRAAGDEITSAAGALASAAGGSGDDDVDAARAIAGAGGSGPSSLTESFAERLKRVHQLTGFADPVYAEAFVRVHEYDVVLEITVINRTDATLANVAVELSTMGDLRLVERPPSFTLGPRDARTIKANIKVSSTETGHIFGTIAYDATTPAAAAAGGGTSVVNMAELHLDILDYVSPAHTSDASFRSMWSDFEWENKVNVNTNLTSLAEFVHHIAKITNMRILTPIASLASSTFLSANLYARSVFGEDALVNVSVESKPDGGIRGHIRIRAKTQGVALSLGDRITAKQKV